jgi:hypothetical protein
MSMLTVLVLLTGIISGYRIVVQRADWANRSLAAEALAMQRMAQVQAARWDHLAWPPVDELSSNGFPEVRWPLEVPIVRGLTNWATLLTTIRDLGTNPPLKSVQVDCVWSIPDRGNFTNTLLTLRGPDQ